MSLTPIELYQSHRTLFDQYQSILLKWNEKINLTAITKPDEIIEKHFLDSLFLLPELSRWLPHFFSENVSRETNPPHTPLLQRGAGGILDIGAGAGFPGIPLKLVNPHLKLTLVDSVKKKCDFLKEVVRSLSLGETEVAYLTLKGQVIGAFDLIVTRATFGLKEYLELAIPNLRPQGILIAMKGAEVEGEIQEAEEIRERLRLRPWEMVRYILPYSKAERRILMTCR